MNKKSERQELFDRPRLTINHPPNEVFVIKEVFPHGVLGMMLVSNKNEILEISGQILNRTGYARDDIVGQPFFDLFTVKEGIRLNYFLKHCSLEYLSVLSCLQLRNSKKGTIWVSIYAKKEKMSVDESGYYIVFLDKEDSFATVTTDKFDTLYRSFFDMHEAELARTALVLRDDVAQELYALRVDMQNFIISHGYEREISVLKKRLNDTIRKISNISNELFPNVFVQVGFLSAMEEMVFAVKKLGYDLKYKIDAGISGKSPEFQFCCYRVVQALFQNWRENVLPYQASLTLSVKGNKVNIRLCESRNIENEPVHNYPDAILHNIRNRIALYDGTIEIDRILDNSQILITMYN